MSKIHLVEILSNSKDRFYSLCGDTFEVGGNSLVAFLPEFADCPECLAKWAALKASK